MSLLSILLIYTVVIWAIGLGSGWYVRGAYLKKKEKKNEDAG